MNRKIQYGQFFTHKNPFEHEAFERWAKLSKLSERKILEPFAGKNSLIRMLEDLGYCKSYDSYDMDPKTHEIQYNDSLAHFPKGYQVCVSNPPYLYKSSAKRRRYAYPDTPFDDLYKYATSLALEHTPYVAMILPASFLQSGLFRERLYAYISLPYKEMFTDTECPVCLALFIPEVKDTLIYEKDTYRGSLNELEQWIPRGTSKVVFNHPQGHLGLIGIDNTKQASIRFVRGDEIDERLVKTSSRHITRIKTHFPISSSFLEYINARFSYFREKTGDTFLTPFKGVRKDGRFRRRIEYLLVRGLLSSR